MELSEKHGESSRNGGRRSRTDSPGGATNGETDSGSDELIPRDRIRVGRDYRAVCPDLMPQPDTLDEIPDKALLVWKPNDELDDKKLDHFMTLAKEKFHYNGEQALGMLFWHKYDLDKAINDLSNFVPFNDDWNPEDKLLFEQAFSFHGKSFIQIRQMLPDKTISNLVKYYYTWKKTKAKRSHMDRQARKYANSSRNENSTISSSGQHDRDGKNTDQNKKWLVSNKKSSTITSRSLNTNANEKSQDENTEIICSHCKIECSLSHNSGPNGPLCMTCFQNWKRTGTLRATRQSLATHLAEKNLLNSEKSALTNTSITTGSDANAGSSTAASAAVTTITTTNTNVVTLNGKTVAKECLEIDEKLLNTIANDYKSRQYLTKKNAHIEKLCFKNRQSDQNIEVLKRKIDRIEKENKSELKEIENFYQEDSERVSLRWSQDEIDLLIDSIRNYGKDFKKIASIIATKNELQVRNFFANSRRKHQLDVVVKEFEDKQNQKTDCNNINTNNSSNKSVSEMVIDLTDDDDV